VPNFDRIRYRCHDDRVFLYAFDLIELDGDDLRREPFETRKATLASVLAKAAPGLRLNEHIEADGPTVFAHGCKMGLEGIVSKRKTSPYRSGRSPDWIKSKNPACEAVRREAEGGRGAGVADALRSASIRGAWLNLALARFIYGGTNQPSLSILLRRGFQTGQHDHICPARVRPS
jgi:hypothetical protein